MKRGREQTDLADMAVGVVAEAAAMAAEVAMAVAVVATRIVIVPRATTANRAGSRVSTACGSWRLNSEIKGQGSDGAAASISTLALLSFLPTVFLLQA